MAASGGSRWNRPRTEKAVASASSRVGSSTWVSLAMVEDGGAQRPVLGEEAPDEAGHRAVEPGAGVPRDAVEDGSDHRVQVGGAERQRVGGGDLRRHPP